MKTLPKLVAPLYVENRFQIAHPQKKDALLEYYAQDSVVVRSPQTPPG